MSDKGLKVLKGIGVAAGVTAFVGALALGVSIIAAQPPRFTVEEEAGEFADLVDKDQTPWVRYKTGEAVHILRVSAIQGAIWTKDGQRNRLYFAGGALDNDITYDEFIRFTGLTVKQEE